MAWSDSEIAQLRIHWDEGLSTAEIGRRLHRSKNSVVSKAHRLDLPERPSPIIRDPNQPPRAYRPQCARAPKVTLPSMAHEPLAIAPPPVRRAPPTSRPAAPTQYRGLCTWPIGDPCTRSFRYCDEPAIAGMSYCHKHAKEAYPGYRAKNQPAESVAT